MSKMSSNSTFGSETRLIGPSKDGGSDRGGRGGGRPGLRGCRGLILDLNDDCEDILEVLMKCRCRKYQKQG